MGKLKTAELVEAEVAFRLTDAKCFPKLLERLWTASGLIDMDGVMAARIGEEIKGAVHLFSDRTRGDQKERLRLGGGKQGLVAKLDRKLLSGRTKFEKNVESSERKKDVVRLMNEIQPVVSLFCKERASLTYKFVSPDGPRDRKAKEQLFTIGIDRIAALPISDGREAKGFAFYDLDIEGDGSGAEMLFARSRYFREELRPLLRPLERATAKWRTAQQANRGVAPVRRSYESYEDVADFYHECLGRFAEVFPVGHGLAGPPVGSR